MHKNLPVDGNGCMDRDPLESPQIVMKWAQESTYVKELEGSMSGVGCRIGGACGYGGSGSGGADEEGGRRICEMLKVVRSERGFVFREFNDVCEGIVKGERGLRFSSPGAGGVYRLDQIPRKSSWTQIEAHIQIHLSLCKNEDQRSITDSKRGYRGKRLFMQGVQGRDFEWIRTARPT